MSGSYYRQCWTCGYEVMARGHVVKFFKTTQKDVSMRGGPKVRDDAEECHLCQFCHHTSHLTNEYMLHVNRMLCVLLDTNFGRRR